MDGSIAACREGIAVGLMPDARPRLSMIRSYTWADLLTLANASCGRLLFAVSGSLMISTIKVPKP
jgi:hypothetical protein